MDIEKYRDYLTKQSTKYLKDLLKTLPSYTDEILIRIQKKALIEGEIANR